MSQERWIFHSRTTLVVLALATGLTASSLCADVVVPSSAFVKGQNSAEFHSDVRVFNPSTSPVNFVPIFYDQSTGETVQKPTVTIGGRTQIAYDNVLSSLFGRSLGAFGPIRIQTTGSLVVSSSVNNVNGCGNGSVSGQWLPGMDVGQAQKTGTLVQLAASSDSQTGYRSNLVFVNPSSTLTTNVTAKVRRGDGSQLSSQTLSPLGPNGFHQINGFSEFPGVAGTTDTNLWMEFTSDNPVLVFASVISNTSGDPFAIVMTPELPVPPAPPVASYTFSPSSPSAGQVVTFTDTSTNSPTNFLWAFGDGGLAVSSGSSTTHTFAAAGTYHSAHFVTNTAGVSGASKDVVVGAAEPQQIIVTASQWRFEPNPLNLNVGTTYQITWQSSDVIHGIGGLAALGITQCNLVASTLPCTVTFTPTANQRGTHDYACTQTSCGAGHNAMTGALVIQ